MDLFAGYAPIGDDRGTQRHRGGSLDKKWRSSRERRRPSLGALSANTLTTSTRNDVYILCPQLKP